MAGLALICPVGDGSAPTPPHRAVFTDPAAYEELEPSLHQGFDEYVVVRTPATARHYRDRTVPGTRLVDQTALERIFADWSIEVSPAYADGPTLIVAGKQDATAGYAAAVDLLETLPKASLVVLNGAGHALLHEWPELVGGLLDDWRKRSLPG